MNEKMLGKREQKNQENRKLIVTTANKLFRENGYAETTMVDISKESELAYGTIYHLYPCKKDILLAIYDFYFGSPIGLNEDREMKLLDPVGSISNFLQEYERRWIAVGASVALNMYMSNKDKKHIDLLAANNNEVHKQELLCFLKFAEERGVLKQEIAPEEATNSIFIFGRGLLFQWALVSGNYDLVCEADPYWKIFLPAFFN